ncbi:MAG: hypothetical protein GX859_10785 [Corynebacterium humireducens]|uniref:Putative host cell surface-exposed lipoprotein Ltp-like HTH region domain-containing protein n=1 Tax=Corynebacterium humireducens TaxID=1223514 RepID=A0A7X6PQ09_9CORY|nr:hypothetical protein [Corynebacterium humireducens]
MVRLPPRGGRLGHRQHVPLRRGLSTPDGGPVKGRQGANALRKANSYLQNSAFSDAGLYEQLIYEGFTPEQASYALANL